MSRIILLEYLVRIQNGIATPEEVRIVKTTEAVQEFINPLHNRQFYLEELQMANWNVDVAEYNIQKKLDADKQPSPEQ